MKSLYDALLDAYNEIPNYNIKQDDILEKIIKDDEEAKKVIANLVPSNNYMEAFDRKCDEKRWSHSLITFLFGIVIGKFCDFFARIWETEDYSNKDQYSLYWIWMLTSILHDSGYYSKQIVNSVNLEDIKVKYDLFDDSCQSELKNYEGKNQNILKCSYVQIKNYYKYIIEYRTILDKKNHEKIDHGILGAYEAYNALLREIVPNKNETVKYSTSDMNHSISSVDILYCKIACLTIAQHNIFKSNSTKSDKLYQKYGLDFLCSNSNYRINIDTPLLALMCLTDTLEFYKKLKEFDDYKIITIFKQCQIEVTFDKIIIDFSNVKLESKNDIKILKEIERDYRGLKVWTAFNVENKNSLFTISLNPDYAKIKIKKDEQGWSYYDLETKL